MTRCSQFQSPEYTSDSYATNRHSAPTLHPSTVKNKVLRILSSHEQIHYLNNPTLCLCTLTNRVFRILTLHSPLISPQLQNSRGSTPLFPSADVSLATSLTHYNKIIISHNSIHDRQWYFYKGGSSPKPSFLQSSLSSHTKYYVCTLSNSPVHNFHYFAIMPSLWFPLSNLSYSFACWCTVLQWETLSQLCIQMKS